MASFLRRGSVESLSSSCRETAESLRKCQGHGRAGQLLPRPSPRHLSPSLENTHCRCWPRTENLIEHWGYLPKARHMKWTHSSPEPRSTNTEWDRRPLLSYPVLSLTENHFLHDNHTTPRLVQKWFWNLRIVLLLHVSFPFGWLI